MKCPDCGHVSETALLRCGSCGELFPRDELETLGHLEFLLAWLDERAASLGEETVEILRNEALDHLGSLRASLDLEPTPVFPLAEPSVKPEVYADPQVVEQIRLLEGVLAHLQEWVTQDVLTVQTGIDMHDHLSKQAADLRAEHLAAGTVLDEPEETSILDFAIAQLPHWSKDLRLQAREGQILYDALRKKRAGVPFAPPKVPLPVQAPAPAAVEVPAAAEARVSIPAAPPKPAFKMPEMDWTKLWERAWGLVVSGALLRGLLYLGAFMIVVSAAVMVIKFWDIFPAFLQVIFIASVPSVFFLAGWLLRSRLQLPQAGGVLTNVGALLVAVDFLAVYQFMQLAGRMNPVAYWLVASIISTAIYGFGVRRLATGFFSVLALLSSMSVLLAFTRLLRLPLEWQIAVVSATTPVMVEGAARLEGFGEQWIHLVRAARRLAQVFLPVCIALVLFVPGKPAFGQMLTFLFATLGFGILAWRFPHVVYAHTSVWSSVGVFAFLFRLIGLPDAAVATAVGLLTVPYILGERWIMGRWPEDTAMTTQLRTATYYARWALLGIAILTGFGTLLIDRWGSVIALAVSSGILVWIAALERKPVFILWGCGLFVLPFSLAIDQWLRIGALFQPVAWLMVAWVGLALLYLVAGTALRKAQAFGSRLTSLAHGLAPVACLGLVINYSVTMDQWDNIPTLVALGGAVLLYLISAVLQDQDRIVGLTQVLANLSDRIKGAVFHWPVGLILPIWIAVAWTGSVFERTWLGAAFAVLALLYVGFGEMAGRRRREYRTPAHMLAYPLIVSAVLIAAGEPWALMTTLYLAVVVFAALAFLYRRIYETIVAAALFIWPFQLSLQLSPLTPHAHSLAYALLASLGYIGLAILVDRKNRRLALPEYVIGYVMAAFAVVASLLGRVGAFALNVPWVGVAVPTIISTLVVLSAIRFELFPFAWAAGATITLAYGQALALLRIPESIIPVMWVTLGYVYLLAERGLSRLGAIRKVGWVGVFHRPLIIAGGLVGGLGLVLTSLGTVRAFSGFEFAGPFPLILTQALGVGLAALGARLYHNRWPAYLAAALSFFPVTWTWIAYIPGLSSVQFAWVWMAAAAVLLVIGFATDKARVRYAHGPYTIGYALAVFALAWSVQDRLVNLYALAAAMILAALSHTVTHYGRHHSFEDFVRFVWRKGDTLAQRLGRNAFLFVIAIGFPIWLVQLLTYHDVSIAWRGTSLALTAPIYVALGLALRRVKADYAWPFYGVGYALTAIGAMVAFDDQRLGIVVLFLGAVVYAASAYIFRQAFWLFLSNALAPILALLILDYYERMNALWVAWIFMLLALGYLAVGWLLNRRVESHKTSVDRFALPFLSIGYLLSAIALAAASGEKMLAMAIFSMGTVFYALSAWAFDETLFLYPAAWLVAVPYYLAMTLTAIPPAWYGLGWLPLILGYLGLGRWVFQKTPLGIVDLRSLRESFKLPSMPFYTLAYILTVSMIAISRDDPLALTLAFAASALVSFGSAAMFKHFGWLYPGLLTTHLAWIAAYVFVPAAVPTQYITLPFLGLTWALALAGLWITRWDTIEPAVLRSRSLTFAEWPFIRHLLKPSWAQPLFVFVALDLLVWQILAFFGVDTAILIALGHALLLALFTMQWRDKALAYGSLFLMLLAAGFRLGWTGMPLAEGLAWFGGIGLGLYLLGWTLQLVLPTVQRVLQSIEIWLKPLRHMAVLLTASAAVGTIPFILVHGRATVASLALAGVLYLTIAYRERRPRLSYLALAMLEIDWVLVLFDQGIRQMQGFAIPSGLYFVLVGHLERRAGRRRFGAIVEAFGLAVMLVSAFIQSLSGVEGFPYFLLLLVEGLLVIWWGAANRRKAPFFMGLGASGLNVIAQVIVLINVYDVQRWIIILGVGVLLVTAAVFVERKREQIIATTQAWLEMLESWE